MVVAVLQEFFDNASGGMTRLEGTHELFAVTVEWERQKVHRPLPTLAFTNSEALNFALV